MNWVILILLFALLHLPGFLFVRYSDWYLEALPAWARMLRNIALVKHYLLDLGFQIFYVAVGGYLGYLLRTYVLMMPGVVSDFVCIFLVTILFNSLLHWCVPSLFVGEFFGVLVSDLAFILGVWVVGAILMYSCPPLLYWIQG